MLNWREMHWAKLKGGFKGNTAFFGNSIFLLHTAPYLSGEDSVFLLYTWRVVSYLMGNLFKSCPLFKVLSIFPSLNPSASSSSVIFFWSYNDHFFLQNSDWNQIEPTQWCWVRDQTKDFKSSNTPSHTSVCWQGRKTTSHWKSRFAVIYY